MSKWVYLSGGTGFGNRQLQWYRTSNAHINPAGQLDITATRGGSKYTCWYGPCKYTSARMETLGKFSQKYGLFEARIKFPPGGGLWPAFWMEGTNITQVGWPKCGEVDVVEPNGRNPRLVAGFAHAAGFRHRAYLTLDQPMTNAFHNFAVAWSPAGITWYFDGHAFSHMKSYSGWPFNRQFFIILNLAVGGVGTDTPTASTPFPSNLAVAWLHVYRAVKAT